MNVYDILLLAALALALGFAVRRIVRSRGSACGCSGQCAGCGHDCARCAAKDCRNGRKAA
ncbi:MAG: FeoB-associated Cys-rich membrane protein [Clostridia bacterium]|nr:FeoB-associated Cys-rich membrane protein [Clostridia bacterium]